VYEVIADPFDAGAVHETEIFPVPAVTETPDGASGAFAGVTKLDEAGTDSPLALIALTVKVYESPFVKPVILREEVVPKTVVPLLAITTKPVIADPPSASGSINETVASASPTVTVTAAGALGTVDGVTALEAVDSPDVPIPLVADTLNV
jgi:hypothetical protein